MLNLSSNLKKRNEKFSDMVLKTLQMGLKLSPFFSDD
jgi:hypothetical protein